MTTTISHCGEKRGANSSHAKVRYRNARMGCLVIHGVIVLRGIGLLRHVPMDAGSGVSGRFLRDAAQRLRVCGLRHSQEINETATVTS